MNDQKICFIMCSNHTLYEQECLYYIHRLKIPDNYEIETVIIHAAESMTSGYNEAMKKTDAKYKVYLHQDVFIVYQDFITAILRIFQDSEIGMIGMVGSMNFDQYAVMWKGKRVGMLHSNSIFLADSYLFGKIEDEYAEVDAIDGLIMVTQYDLPWRSDIFKKWDFYDASQSREFILKGYKIVVPHTDFPWCIHDDGILNMRNYYNERQLYLQNYQDRRGN